MSMATCSKCGDLVDTDMDCNFYDFDYKTKTGYCGHCVTCRDEILEAMTDKEHAEHEKRIYG